MARQLTAETEQLIDRHRAAGILLDTNLLLLWIVGSIDPEMIARHKRTAVFTVQDFATLTEIVTRCSRRLTTPNVLTETISLLVQTDGLGQARLVQGFIDHLLQLRESYYRSLDLVAAPQFPALRLADTSLLRAAQRGRLIVSADYKLCSLIGTNGGAAINFNYLRSIR